MDFKGKVVLITGASSGIGAATAVHFARLGASLTLNGRNKENMDKVFEQCRQISAASEPLVVLGDVTDEAVVKNMIDATINRFGKLDVLVNNAAYGIFGGIENTSLEQYDKLMNTNVRAVYHLTMLAVPHLIKTKGNIVNVSSVAGFRAFPGALSYCLSKAAIDQFTRCVALDLAPKQVRVNAVNPGVIVTNFQKTAGMDSATYETFLEGAKKMHAMERVGLPEEVAAPIAFLASDAASDITGVTLPVDGGMSLMCPR